jgi:cysteine-rich repeat protein
MTNLTRTGILAIGAAALLVAGPAGAQPTKESLKCSSTKLKIYSKDVASLLKCEEKAVLKGEPVDPACVLKATDKTTDAFAKAELKGGCPTDASTAPIEGGNLLNTRARLSAYVASVTAALAPNPGPSKCQASKLKAVGKLTSSLFNCESKAAAKNVAVDQVKCVQKAIDKLADPVKGAFAKAEAKPPCDTTGDAATRVGEAQEVVRDQTVLTPRFNGCGNKLIRSPETCDDGNTENFDNCPSDCTVDFCAPTAGVRNVILVTSRPDLSAVTVNLDYPEGKVNLQGIGGDIPAGIVTPFFGSSSTNDFDHALRHVQFDAFDFGGQNIAQFAFNDCNGATPPVGGDFTCTVVDAGQEDGVGGFQTVSGATCSVTVLP